MSPPAVSDGEKNPKPGVVFESKNEVHDSVQTSLGSWSNAQISQQVFTTNAIEMMLFQIGPATSLAMSLMLVYLDLT